ncbi:XRE family transcriptional regulator [Pseudomonas aeruginosa]|uniref:helix-turn-helix domain-containing protein n=1 Tax=Pseudomonas aeruginosa TaxID=287 RepID=UPI0027776E3E|nr:XRE family transcriptional regulator [Pseudomonas aeruginosa]
MGRKETEEAIADCRAGRVTRVGSVAELLAELNADDTPDVQQGSTNVYADLGFPDADEMLVKAQLVAKIGEAIKARQWSPEQAATALDVTPTTLRELLAGRFRSRSVDDLERLAALLDEARR